MIFDMGEIHTKYIIIYTYMFKIGEEYTLDEVKKTFLNVQEAVDGKTFYAEGEFKNDKEEMFWNLEFEISDGNILTLKSMFDVFGNDGSFYLNSTYSFQYIQSFISDLSDEYEMLPVYKDVNGIETIEIVGLEDSNSAGDRIILKRNDEGLYVCVEK